MQDFKVGDEVIITKSDIDWYPDMNEFIGKKVVLTEVTNYISGDSHIGFEGSSYYTWSFGKGHFTKVNEASEVYAIF